MASKQLKVEVRRQEMIAGDEPVSPTGQYFTTSALNVSVMVVFEAELPIDEYESKIVSGLQNLFLVINPRFSSIMLRDEQGVLRWKKVKVELEDHVHLPIFPAGLEYYDDYVEDHLSKVAVARLPQSKPLWELHFLKYPTTKAAGSVAFKLHHALGDGYSLMAALFNVLQRADDPSLPLTFPSFTRVKPQPTGVPGMLQRVPRLLSTCFNTIRDFGRSVLQSYFAADDITPVRSGEAGVEFRPIVMPSVDFSLDDVKEIKGKLGGTLNDVICAIVFYGLRLYIEAAAKGTIKPTQVTALVLLNTRAIGKYEELSEMTKPGSKAPWGNHIGLLHLPLPNCKDDEKANPLHFVTETRRTIDAKKNSLAVHATDVLLDILKRFGGPETAGRYVHSTLRNTSMSISNLIGPYEQMSIMGNPIRNFYFMSLGVPQSLTITIVSYMGRLKVTFGIEKGFIKSQLLISCMEKSFERIFEEAAGKKQD